VKAKQRVAAGIWVSPLADETPEAEALRLARMGMKSRQVRRAEVEAGAWRNPALTPAARAKLSRPRTILDPVLHQAQEKLNSGQRVADLTPEEQAAYRAHRREMERAQRERWTPEERERRHEKWREYARRARERRKSKGGEG